MCTEVGSSELHEGGSERESDREQGGREEWGCVEVAS